MKEIVLNGVAIDLWTRELDTLAWQQISNISKLPFIHHHVAVMADGHGGSGVPIGCVLPVKGVVIPNAIGTDCGCGMRAVKSDVKVADITTDVLRKSIGYHYYIERDGQLYQTRDEEEVGMHARHYNAHSIGICYEGGLDEKGRDADTRTPAQRASLIALLRSLMVDYPDARIMGHCELEGVHKACPCFEVSEYRDYFAHLSTLN